MFTEDIVTKHVPHTNKKNTTDGEITTGRTRRTVFGRTYNSIIYSKMCSVIVGVCVCE